MRLLILYASISNNNRVLASHLAERLGADIAEARDPRWFLKLRLMFDLSKDLHPTLAPIPFEMGDYDHVLFIAPLFDSRIAPAMKTALADWGRKAASYSFVTFCGYDSPEQRTKVREQLVDLTGKGPTHLSALCVGDLVPEKDRRKILVVSNYKVRKTQLAQFSEQIDEIAGWFRS